MNLRRLLRRPPTVADCLRATLAESGQRPHLAPVRNAEPAPAPSPAPRFSRYHPPPPWYCDPYAGVVTGPLLVERTKWISAWHQKRYGDDRGFPAIEWGPFDEGDI